MTISSATGGLTGIPEIEGLSPILYCDGKVVEPEEEGDGEITFKAPDFTGCLLTFTANGVAVKTARQEIEKVETPSAYLEIDPTLSLNTVEGIVYLKEVPDADGDGVCDTLENKKISKDGKVEELPKAKKTVILVFEGDNLVE